MSKTILKNSVIGINIFILIYLLGRNLDIIKLCGGIFNPWLFIDFFSCITIPAFIVYGILSIRSKNKIAITLLVLNITFLVFLFLPINHKQLNFSLQKYWYEKTTQDIETGKLIVYDRLKFPHSLLTACGQVDQKRENGIQYIFYVTEIDWLSIEGFLHSPDNKLPGDSFFDGRIYPSHKPSELCKPLTDHWFYCEFED